MAEDDGGHADMLVGGAFDEGVPEGVQGGGGEDGQIDGDVHGRSFFMGSG